VLASPRLFRCLVDHAAGVAGDAVVGEEVGRVGEDEVDGVFGECGEDIEAIALVDADVVFIVAEDGGRQRPGGSLGSARDGLRCARCGCGGGLVGRAGSLGSARDSRDCARRSFGHGRGLMLINGDRSSNGELCQALWPPEVGRCRTKSTPLPT
jgi:hypothetical protein